MSKSEDTNEKDFGADGIDIQAAMVRHIQAYPDRATRPNHIWWNGKAVWTVCNIAVPKKGRFRIEFLSEPRDPSQGVDVKVEDGTVTLPGGEGVQILRTWHEPGCEAVAEYPYSSEVGLLKIWNVYKRCWPNGRTTEEKWTGNAGFLVEREARDQWLFRCSNGPSDLPDFNQLVFRLQVISKQ